MPSSSQLTHDQMYLLGVLRGASEHWAKLRESGIAKLNKEFGRPTVTQALQRVREEDGAAARRPFPLLRSICVAILEESA